MLKLATYGKMWNRWSWAVFFIFLWQYLTAHGRDEPNRSYDGTPEDVVSSDLFLQLILILQPRN